MDVHRLLGVHLSPLYSLPSDIDDSKESAGKADSALLAVLDDRGRVALGERVGRDDGVDGSFGRRFGKGLSALPREDQARVSMCPVGMQEDKSLETHNRKTLGSNVRGPRSSPLKGRSG